MSWESENVLTSLFKCLFNYTFYHPTLFRKCFVDLHFAQVLEIFVVNIYDKRLIRSTDKMQPFCFFTFWRLISKTEKWKEKLSGIQSFLFENILKIIYAILKCLLQLANFFFNFLITTASIRKSFLVSFWTLLIVSKVENIPA